MASISLTHAFSPFRLLLLFLLASVLPGMAQNPEIAVEQPADANLNSGATVNFGMQRAGVAGAARTFTIKNTGAGALTVSSVDVTGGNAADFTVNKTGMAGSVPATTGSTTFTVTFNPSIPGLYSTTLRIANNDSDEGTFDLLLTGTGIGLPGIATNEAALVTSTTAFLGGSVFNDNFSPVLEWGYVWNTTGFPTVAVNKIPSGTPPGRGYFTDTVTGFPSGTRIYFRAYARNEAGLAYGREYTFTTTMVAAPGTIVWSPTQNWTGAAAQVLTNGARHAAVCFVPSTAANPVVNGLTFDRPAAASPATSDTTATTFNFVNGSNITVSSWWYNATSTPVSGSGDFVSIVNQGSFNQLQPGTITLGSLVVGQDYQVQIFMPYWEALWPTTFASVGGVPVTLSSGRATGTPSAPQYATGTFTAAATSHVINFSAAAPGPWAGVSAISVRRTSLSANADLSALTTTAGSLTFAAATTSYTASVPNATPSVTVTPTVADANATVTVNGTSVASGNASGNIALTVGANAIPVVVTAQSGATKTYTLTVTRAAPALTGIAITPTSVITTSQWVGPAPGVRARMIDGSGLSGGGSVLTQTHDELVTAETMWHSGPDSGGIIGGVTGLPPLGAPPVNTQAVEFDLGANYDLSGAHIWNMNQSGNQNRGVKDVQISFSSATTGAFSTATTTQFTQGTGAAGLAAQVVPLTGATNVRRVRFAIQSSWGGDYVGLSEVRFQGTAAVPATPPTLVTTISDIGPGSLRAAIEYANATAGADTITFSDGTGGTVNFTDTTPEIIDLATVLPDLATDITITGPGADKLTIRRPATSPEFRIFHVSSDTATVSLSGLTVTGGNSNFSNGGGIRNLGTLTVTACAITGNTAGTSSGGGIFSRGSSSSTGSLTVHSSTISGNSAGFGGGVWSATSSPTFTVASTVTLLVNTTLSGNTATFSGGGFYNNNGLSYLVNCTLTGNSAPASKGGGVATLGNSTTETRFANTLCVGNTGGGDVDFVNGGLNSNTSLGGNLIGTGNSGASFTGQTTAAAASTILNTTLASNGGPSQTHALIPGSPALNAGVNANAKNPTDAIFGDANDVALTTDQRGSTFLRTIGTVDVGAFESQTAVLSTNADLASLTTTAGALSPAFAAGTIAYTASVPNATTSVTVTPTVAQAGATVKVNTVTVSSGAASGPISLNVGANTITTVVTAQDGTTTKTYTLTVTRAAPALTGIAITPTSVITTSQWVGPTPGVRARMIDGSGLSGGGSVLTQTHDELVTAETMWHAGPDSGGIIGGETGPPPFGAPPVNTQAVEFDLGANYDLSGAHIWNMNQAGNQNRGVKDVQILVSTSTTAAFTPLITTIFTQGTGNAGLAAQVVPLTGATNVRRVRFAIQSAWSGLAEEYVGLSEVRFQGTPAATIPGAPVIGTATAGDASASVTFTAPASNGGSPITGYIVTSSPGGITATGAGSPINVTGLTNGTAYTFTVRATNAVGPSPASASSNSVTPVAPSTVGEVAGSNLPLPIPDNNHLTGANVLFPVSGRTGTVTAVSVQFTLNPAHTYASDLSVQLIAPDNTMTPIFNIGVDDDSDLGGPYTFQDSAAGYLSTAAWFVGPLAVAASGTYRAENAGNQILLNTVFANKAPNGTWKLRFIDLSGTDTGTVSQASLNLTTSAASVVIGQGAITPLAGGAMQVSLSQATAGTNLRLQRSTDLSGWTTLQTVTVSAGGTASFTDNTPPAGRAFYRFTP